MESFLTYLQISLRILRKAIQDRFSVEDLLAFASGKRNYSRKFLYFKKTYFVLRQFAKKNSITEFFIGILVRILFLIALQPVDYKSATPVKRHLSRYLAELIFGTCKCKREKL